MKVPQFEHWVEVALAEALLTALPSKQRTSRRGSGTGAHGCFQDAPPLGHQIALSGAAPREPKGNSNPRGPLERQG